MNMPASLITSRAFLKYRVTDNFNFSPIKRATGDDDIIACSKGPLLRRTTGPDAITVWQTTSPWPSVGRVFPCDGLPVPI